jgi:hypothetical protein
MLILWHPRFRKLFVQRTFIAQSCSVSELLDPEEIESSHKTNSLLCNSVHKVQVLHADQTTNQKPHYNFKAMRNLRVYWSIANLEHIILTMPTTNDLLRTEQFAL